ncbi:hypothetical protein LCGC14_1651560 [marine sediment metagenome]|uniref:Uncharacterized protein n=1 Tax=marine sediment metagenome TaxID=412755 RepID=A0A0F9KCF7_9ZZZZ
MIDGNYDMIKCCFIPCEKEAEWSIVHGPASNDVTESCDDHVSDLRPDAPEHIISRVHRGFRRIPSKS